MSIANILAWRYLHSRWVRSLLTLLAIMIGVMIMFGMQGVIPAVRASFGQNLNNAAHEVDLILSRRDQGSFPQALAQQISTIPGVAHVLPVLEQRIFLPDTHAITANDGRLITRLVVNGVEPTHVEAVIPIAPLEGRWLEHSDDDQAVLIRQSLVERSGLAIGDQVRLPHANGDLLLTIIGVLPERPIAGDEEIYISLAAAQYLFDQPDRITAVVAQFDDTADPEQLRLQITNQIGPSYSIGAVEAGSSQWESVLQLGEIAFLLFGGLALAMGGFIIFNTFRTSIAERRRDIGLLRTLGASQHTILMIILTECCLLAIAGTSLGILSGMLLVQLLITTINPAWVSFFGVPLGTLTFGWQAWFVSILLGLVIPLLSCLFPALAARRMPPLEALRPIDIQEPQQNHQRLLIGIGMLVIACFGFISGNPSMAILGSLLSLIALNTLGPLLVPIFARIATPVIDRLFPHIGMIAQGYLRHNPHRAAVTASSILISLALLLALAGLSQTFTSGLLGFLEQSMRADYLIMPESAILGQAETGADPSLAQRLRTIPGIRATTTIRQSSMTIDGQTTQLLGIDPATYPLLAGLSFTTGDPTSAYQALATQPTIIVNGVAAAQYRLDLGESLTIATVDGPVAYRVVGVGVDYLNSRQATVYLSQAQLTRITGQQDDLLLFANRDPAADPLVIETAISELLGDYPTFALINFATWREQQVASNQARNNLLYGLMVILAIPSLLALANTLGINLLERTRELGILRAIGATHQQLQRMVIAESLLLATFGVCGGLVAGVGLGYALVIALQGRGLLFPYVVPISSIIIVGLIGFGIALVAALIPARYITRLNILAALHWE
ncbi:MAG: FtsX-like permease family protein [Roseiflexaceae bacterium]